MAGNWKMFKTPAETRAFFEAFKPLVAASANDIAICPSFTNLQAAVDSKRLDPSKTVTAESLVESGILRRAHDDPGVPQRAITDERGNSITRLPAARNAGGRDLLLYGHFDTSFTGDLTEDFPVQGREPRPDLEPVLRRVPHAGGEMAWGCPANY